MSTLKEGSFLDGAGGGTGDVTGGASSTDNAVARHDGTTGKVIQDSGVIIDDSDNVTGVNDLTITGTLDGADSGMIAMDTTFDINTPDHVTNMHVAMRHIWSSGVTDGAGLTDNADGTIGLAESNAMIRSSASDDADIYNVRVAAQTPISLTDDATNYIYLDYNAGSPQYVVSTSDTSHNGQDKVLAFLVHRDGNDLNYLDLRNFNVDSVAKSNHLFQDFSRFIHASGGSIISEPTSLTIGVTSGGFYFMTEKTTHVAFDTSIAGTANANVFDMHYRDGVGGWTHVVNSKVIDPSTYDNNTGTPVALSNNSKYGVTWFYIVNDSPSSLAAVMGQVEYNSEAEALAATAPSTLPSILDNGLGVVVGVAVYNKIDTSFSGLLNPFTQTFTGTAATNHNALGGLQGGTASEYYHLTSSDYTALTPSNVALTGGSITGLTTFDVSDSVFRIQDNTDPTKQVSWELGGNTTGTNRVITAPNSNLNLENVSSLMAVTNRIGQTTDTNTYLDFFGSDNLTVHVGGINMVKYTEGSTDIITFNPDNLNIDFNVKTDSSKYGIRVDAGAENVAIMTSATAATGTSLEIGGTSSVLITRGTTAEAPATGINGMIRYDSTTNKFVVYENSGWADLIDVTPSSTTTFTNKTFDANGTGNSITNVDLSADVTGTAPIANGGTGQTTQTGAFDALAPTTTQGDVMYHNGTDNIRLAKGTADQVLTMNTGATAPEWQTIGGGKVLQVVQATTTTATSSTSSTYADATGITVNITPSSTSSKVLVLVSGVGYITGAAATGASMQINRGATGVTHLDYVWFSIGASNEPLSLGMCYLDSPSTTSSTTYKLQFKRIAGTGTVYMNGLGTSVATITVMEIGA